MHARPLLFVAALFCCISAYAQRDLEFVTDIPDPWLHDPGLYMDGVAAGGSAYIGHFYNDALVEFRDGTGLLRHYYPFAGSERLIYPAYGEYFYHKPMAIYNGQLYLVLSLPFTSWTEPWQSWLYRFDGSRFTRITLPGRIASNPVVFGPYMYFMVETDRTEDFRLYRYNGSTVSAVPSGTMPRSNFNYLHVSGNYLYLVKDGTGIGWAPFEAKRFDGATFSTITPPHLYNHPEPDGFYSVGSTSYIKIWRTIEYFDGTSVRAAFEGSTPDLRCALWNNSLYVIDESRLYRIYEGYVTEIPLPAGATLSSYTGPVTDDDGVYVVVRYASDDYRVLRYDGTRFTIYFTDPQTSVGSMNIYMREGKLVFANMYSGNPYGYEYDGTSAIELLEPMGHHSQRYLTSTDCYHLWISNFTNAVGKRRALLKESKGCPPTPPPPPPPPPLAVPVIPEYLQQLEKFDLTVQGKNRGWCWNEIIIEWDIEPCENPPCIEPLFDINAFDKSGKLAWQKSVDAPMQVAVPLKDDQPYRFRFTAGENAKNLFEFDNDLVDKGIESINLFMKPGDKLFKLTVATDKNEKVPFQISLLNENGDVIWEKDFEAPFSTSITDSLEKTGHTLRFSVPVKNNKSVITQLNVFPNPSTKQINLRVDPENITTNAVLSISTLQGQKILDRKISIPYHQPIRLDKLKPGNYVLKIVTDKEVISKIIRVN